MSVGTWRSAPISHELLSECGYRVEIAESAGHARRIGFEGIDLAIVAPDGLGPMGRGLVQDLRAAVGRVMLVAAPGHKGERHGHLRDVSDEAGLLARVAAALTPPAEPEALEPVLQFAGYRLDLAGHSLLDTTGKEVPLTHGEFGLLRVFVQTGGTGTVARPIAAASVWARRRGLRPQHRHADRPFAPQD